MTITLRGCTATPFGSYLKAVGVLRIVSRQADGEARGQWDGDVFKLETSVTEDQLVDFYLNRYQPTPILAPWNGGSGFYPKDNKQGIDAIANSTDSRFDTYRRDIETCRNFPEVLQGKSECDEDARRGAILRRCRNALSDEAVEWLDAALGIAADGSRSFAPVLGTGGNEGRLDYTNNFMSRLASLLIKPDVKTPVASLLRNALYGEATGGLQPGAAGQFDPGRAGGANQGPGIAHESATNPWELVLTLEGAVAWASGLYRRQGIAYRKVLCSPFTVYCRAVGYGSSSAKDGSDARAEIWTPVWKQPVGYPELRTLLREGRAAVNGKAAENTLDFAEAVCMLGVDRNISHFVRYGLLKRRGDSYVALPAGVFPTGYRSHADLVRQLMTVVDSLDIPKGAEDLRRTVESAAFECLLRGHSERFVELMAAVGRMFRCAATATGFRLPSGKLNNAAVWLEACGFAGSPEVRIAASLASIFTREVGSMGDHLPSSGKRSAWNGADLPARLTSVLQRRIHLGNAIEAKYNPLGGACELDPGDATLFIDHAVDDRVIEDLLFAFVTLNWSNFQAPPYLSSAQVLPVYAVLKHLFLGGQVRWSDEELVLRGDLRILSLLLAENIREAADVAVHRLRVAKLRPLDVRYSGGVEARRLAASLLIPVRQNYTLASGIFHDMESALEANA